jgi:hypothetical protein
VGEIEIITKATLNVHEDTYTRCTCDIAKETLEKNVPLNVSGPLECNTQLLVEQIQLLRVAYLDAYSCYKDSKGNLSCADTVSNHGLVLRLLESELSYYTQLFLSTGALPQHINPFKSKVLLYLLETDYFRLETTCKLIYKYLFRYTGLDLISTSGVTATGTLTLVDETGPQIMHEIPISGSVFNNPQTSISFDLIDTGGSDIFNGGTDLYINGIQVISGGSDVTPSYFGTTSLTKVTNYYYAFNFEPKDPFSADSLVTISGQARDSIGLGGNISYYLYSFSVWKSSDLAVTITGLPDSMPPYLDNVSPVDLDMDVPVTSNIVFDIIDEHTGLKFSSVNIELNDIPLVTTGTINSTLDYDISITPISGGLGNRYFINPTTNFEFSKTMVVSIYAEDLYIIPNILDTTITFITQTNAHLIASGLSIFEDSTYTEMGVEQSYLTDTENHFVIDFINTSGIPIDTLGSYISLNTETIPSVFVTASGTEDHYKVYFELDTDYETDAELLFHVQQSGTVHGNIVYKDFNSKLLWGYELHQIGEDKFDYYKEIVTLVQLTDFANYNTISSFASKFMTRPMAQVGLVGAINALPLIYSEILGQTISHNPFHEYGKTMSLRLEASDYAGNKLVYEWKYTIEDSPE